MLKRALKRSTAMAAGIVGLACAGAHADVIVDPGNNGSNGVFPNKNILEAANNGGTVDFNDITATSQLNIGTSGSFGAPGVLLLNAENAANGITRLINVARINLGPEAGRSGELRIVGDGSANSAHITVLEGIRLGDGGAATINIEAGGRLTTFGQGAGVTGVQDFGGDSVIRVDGAGSLLNTQEIVLGRDAGAENSITVSDGGFIQAKSGLAFVSIGRNFRDGAGDSNTLTVTGAGSMLSVGNGASSGGGLAVGSKGASALQVLDGGRISGDDGVFIGGIGDASGLVSGSGSRIDEAASIGVGGVAAWTGNWNGPCCDNPLNADTHGSLTIENGGVVTAGQVVNVSSAEAAGTGFLTVSSGGVLEAPTVNIFGGGVLNGDGGTIISDVVVNGGTVAPGNSPGVLTVDGDLTLSSLASVIEIEFASESVFDVLNITGDLTADNGFTLELSFLDGFAPEDGAMFSFLNVDGMTLVDLAMVDIVVEGLGDGFSFAVNAIDGMFSVVASGGDPGEVPVPGAAVLLLTGIGGLIATRRKKRSA